MMRKHWIAWTVFVAVVVMGIGCRSARYRVQRYYKYPPTYTSSTGTVRRAEMSAAPAAASPRAQATGVATNAQRYPGGPPVASQSVTGQAIRAETKKTSPSFWKRMFGGHGEGVAKASAPVATASSPPSSLAQKTGDSNPVEPKVEEKKEAASTGVYRLKVGDPVVVYLRGIPGVPGGEQQIENIVGEDGTIPLPYVSNIKVVDMTATEAQEAVRKAYIEQQIYKHLTVNVVIPARSYYIRGEVRQPGRYPLVGNVTVLQAIAAAGGYTEFASYSVEIVRGDRRIPLNMRQVEKRPELDQSIEPGDIIVVNRSFF